MRLKLSICFLLIGLFFSCKSFHYLPGEIVGNYKEMNEDGTTSGKNLIIDGTGFALVDNGPYRDRSGFICCDSITYGSWKIDNVHGILSLSTPQLPQYFVSEKVHEESGLSKDSLYFFITNPIERSMGEKHENILYNIFFQSYTPSELHNSGLRTHLSLDDSVANIKYNTNRIVIANKNHAKITSFTIIIMPTADYSGRNALRLILTKQQIVNDGNSNVFKINMPDLTYGFITYLRLTDVYVKIVNNNELEWNGNRYLKAQ